MIIWLVMLLGGVGAAARFITDGIMRSRWGSAFPVATLTINVSGSLLIGLLTGALLFHGLDPDVYLAVTVGFCGGYTTFSTAMVETVQLIQAGRIRPAAVNVLGSLVLSVAAAAAGVSLLWLTA